MSHDWKEWKSETLPFGLKYDEDSIPEGPPGVGGYWLGYAIRHQQELRLDIWRGSDGTLYFKYSFWPRQRC